MARGGKREGAGRKAGTANKASIARQAEVAATGQTPLDYMLGVMRNAEQPMPVRLDAAKAAAPFVHPKLSSIEAKVEGTITRTVRKIERVIVDPKPTDA